MTDRFFKGDIVSYPYLWRWQRDADPVRDHGEKDRPTCLILTMIDAKGLTHMLLLPISSKPPFEGQTAIETHGLSCNAPTFRNTGEAGSRSASAITIFWRNPITSIRAKRRSENSAIRFSKSCARNSLHS